MTVKKVTTMISCSVFDESNVMHFNFNKRLSDNWKDYDKKGNFNQANQMSIGSVYT
jgi:hypothetical protein